MKLTFLDAIAIFGYLAATLLLGLYFRRKSGKSTEDYFVSGRQVSWWLAGTSMVATTFAADTPLAVTGLVFAQGISGNWLWWRFSVGNDDGVFIRAIVAALGITHRRAICRNALRWKTCRISAWIPCRISWSANELPDPRLGDEGDDQHRQRHAWPERCEKPRPLHFFPDAIYGPIRRPRRLVGRSVDRPFSIHFENVDRDRRRMVWSARGRRNELVAGEAGRDAHSGGSECI